MTASTRSGGSLIACLANRRMVIGTPRSTAMEFGPPNGRFNAIYPAPVATRMLRLSTD